MVDRVHFACLFAFIFLLCSGLLPWSGPLQHMFVHSFLGVPEAEAAACTVTTTADGGPGSLRHCIVVANTSPGTMIHFDMEAEPNSRDGQGNTWWRIAVLSPLPAITSHETVIDGTTQRGDTNAKGPEIEIHGGSAAGGADGLVVSGASSVVIKGLVISGFRSGAGGGGTGILITGAGAADNRVEENYIGTDATGTAAAGNDNGIAVRGAGTGNRIGGSADGAGNVISGNRNEGLWVSDTTGTIVRGNFIGTNRAKAAVPNKRDGIRLQNAPGTIIGGGLAGARNVVPGRNYMAGCRKSPAMVLDTTVSDVPVEVRGSVDAFALLVNTRLVDLPAADIRIHGDVSDEIIDMRGNETDKSLEFQTDINSPGMVSSWSMNVSDLQGNVLWSTKGEGQPSAALLLDGLGKQSPTLRRGDVYQYQMTVHYKDGSRVMSPVRLFGLNSGSALSGNEERPRIFDRYRSRPVVRINKAAVPANDGGRFSHMIEEKCDHIEIELRDAQGRSVETLLPLPRINLHLPCQGMYVPFQLSKSGEDSPQELQQKGENSEARLDVKGETEKGNTLKMNGQDVNIAEDGAFVLGLRLREGDNTYELELSNPAGYTRHVMLVARATLEKPRRRSDGDGRETQDSEKSEGTQK